MDSITSGWDHLAQILKEKMGPEAADYIRSWKISEHKWGVVAGCVAGYAVYKLITRPRNLPPGPVSLPIIGGMYRLSDQDELLFTDNAKMLSKQYGDIFSIDMGPRTWVMITSRELIKEALVTKAADFADRPIEYMNSIRVTKEELFNVHYSEEHKRKKKFALQTLKTFGFGTAKGEKTIMNEVEEVISVFRRSNGQPISVKTIFDKAAANIISTIWFTERFDFDDPELMHYIDLVDDFFGKVFAFAFAEGLYVDLFPRWMFRLLFRSKVKTACDATEGMINHLVAKIKKHRETLDKDNPRDAVDVYLSEREGEEGFDDEVLAGTILLLSGDAIDTKAIFLKWFCLYMVLYPDIQRKMYNEIEEVCGVSKPVGLSDRSNMPYTEAVVNEVFRHTCMSSFPAVHSAAKDSTLGGYNIPKGTPLLCSFYCLNFDPRLWKDPQAFVPERHLDKDGKFNRTSLELVTPFGIGRRMCLGEQLSRSSIFLMVTNILQKFTLTLPEHQPRPSLSDRMEGKLSPCPADYKIKVTPR